MEAALKDSITRPQDADLLKLQLYPKTYVPGKDYLVREDIPNTLTAIVVDTPTSLVLAKKDSFTGLPDNTDEIFSLLLKKLAQSPPNITVQFVEIQKDEIAAVILGDEITTTTHALVLQELYPQLVGPAGALVSIPHRHAVIVKSLNTEPTSGLVTAVKRLTAHMSQGRTDVISHDIYHFNHGQFRTM